MRAGLGSLVVTIGGITASVSRHVQEMQAEGCSEHAIDYMIGKAIGDYSECDPPPVYPVTYEDIGAQV